LEERFVAEWLEQKARTADLGRSDPNVVIIIGSHENGRNSVVVGSEPMVQFETAYRGHRQIDD
jgi:hypothetical protein